MNKGFTLLEVLLASIILGLGLTAILVSLGQSQRVLFMIKDQQTVQEMFDLGEMAYPLDKVEDPDKDLDINEWQDAEDLWDEFAGRNNSADAIRMTREQKDKYDGFYWRREALNKDDDEELERNGGLYTVRCTVKWGNDLRGHHEEESYVTIWRKKN